MFAPPPRSSLRLLAGIVLLLTTCTEFALGVDVPAPDKRLLRFDPITQTLVPVAESEARVGCGPSGVRPALCTLWYGVVIGSADTFYFDFFFRNRRASVSTTSSTSGRDANRPRFAPTAVAPIP